MVMTLVCEQVMGYYGWYSPNANAKETIAASALLQGLQAGEFSGK